MNELIEAGDPRAKVVGGRHIVLSNAKKFDHVQKQFQSLWPTLPFPKGVHRFKTEEEAHQWKENKMIQRSLDRLHLAKVLRAEGSPVPPTPLSP